MKYFKFLSLLTATVLTACGLPGSHQEKTPQKRIFISSVSIVDVEKGVTVPGQTVVVNGEKIEDIGTAGEIQLPPGAKIVDGLTALDFLTASQGMVVPIYKIIFKPELVTQKLGGHLIYDSIIRIESQPGKHTLIGKSGQVYHAEKVVVATPATVTQQMLGVQEIRAASQLHVFHVNARLKAEFRQYSSNLFPYSSEIMMTIKQHDGTCLIYSRVKEVDLHQVCEQFQLLATIHWDKAMYTQGAAYLEQYHGDDIYVAGDHNGLGLEPTAISGIFAANQILGKEA